MEAYPVTTEAINLLEIMPKWVVVALIVFVFLIFMIFALGSNPTSEDDDDDDDIEFWLE